MIMSQHIVCFPGGLLVEKWFPKEFPPQIIFSYSLGLHSLTTASNPCGSLLATLISGGSNGHWVVYFPVYALYQHQTLAQSMHRNCNDDNDQYSNCIWFNKWN